MNKFVITALFVVMLSFGNLSLNSVYALDFPVIISDGGGGICQFTPNVINIQPGSTVTFTTFNVPTNLDKFGTVFGPILLTSNGDSTSPLFTTLGSFQFDNNCAGNPLNVKVIINVVNSLVDSDLDQFPNELDNCPNDSNADQQDVDNDGIGNTCDTLDDSSCGIGTYPDNVLGQCIGTAGSVVCGPKTEEIAGICVPDLNQICGQGTMIVQGMCIVEQMGQMVGGTLLEIDNYALFAAAIGTNPVITGLVAITLAGVAGQAVWFIHKKKNSNKS
ncbi:MAG: hypothetical protein ACHQ1D_02220 [Nitrososphaerales archaeon]